MRMLTRVEISNYSTGQKMTGRIVAQREKTNEIYVYVDYPTTKFDNWYPATAWTVSTE